jgi:GNAT superfamily N-acetyltransferase
MSRSDYVTRSMTRAEVDLAIDWAAAEGWNPGLHDAACFHAADPNGFLVGQLGDEPIATLSAVRYGDSFGFLGFYIVKPAHRGRGYGIALWNAGLAYLRGRTIGLDGVPAQQDNYRRSGFALAYRNVRHQGQGGGPHPDDAAIVPLSTRAFDEVQVYDRPFFHDDRTRFLERWIAQPESTALGIVQNGRLKGYGVVRRCRVGCKIGPLFADSDELAERLFLALRAHTPAAAPLFLDTPAVNAAAVDLAQRHGMTMVFETARMYAGEAHALPVNRLYGVTTFELG